MYLEWDCRHDTGYINTEYLKYGTANSSLEYKASRWHTHVKSLVTVMTEISGSQLVLTFTLDQIYYVLNKNIFNFIYVFVYFTILSTRKQTIPYKINLILDSETKVHSIYESGSARLKEL